MNKDSIREGLATDLAKYSPEFRRGVAQVELVEQVVQSGNKFQLAPIWQEKLRLAQNALTDLKHLFSTWDVIENPKDSDRCELIQPSTPVPNCPPPPPFTVG